MWDDSIIFLLVVLVIWQTGPTNVFSFTCSIVFNYCFCVLSMELHAIVSNSLRLCLYKILHWGYLRELERPPPTGPCEIKLKVSPHWQNAHFYFVKALPPPPPPTTNISFELRPCRYIIFYNFPQSQCLHYMYSMLKCNLTLKHIGSVSKCCIKLLFK